MALLIAALALPCAATGQARRAAATSSAKCRVLREWHSRATATRDSAVDVVNAVNAENDTAMRNAFVSLELSTARTAVARLRVESCDAGMSLSDPRRHEQLSRARASFLVQAQADRLAVDSANHVGEVSDSLIARPFDDEMRMLYVAPAFAALDPDVPRVFSNLPGEIGGSSLDGPTKQVLSANVGLMRFEEAGRLLDALSDRDPGRGLAYSYRLRTMLERRLADSTATTAMLSKIRQDVADAKHRALLDSYRDIAMRIVLLAILAALVLVPLWVFTSYTRAKFRAFKTGAKRVPFWAGHAELILWDPGETVVILEHKRLAPMAEPRGGYRVISPWRGQEYKGRISYKTQFSTWRSGPILTSDGLTVTVALGIWWRICDANVYVSAIASDYHQDSTVKHDDLPNAADVWIEKLAAGTLREEINTLPTEKLISPYVQAYIQAPSNGVTQPLPQFSEILETASHKLDAKTRRYGLEIERIEVQELTLPRMYQDKLEAVRMAFLEKYQSQGETDARVIALEGLAGVIGKDRVGLIEILKNVHMPNSMVSGFGGVIPMIQPVTQAVERETQKAMSPEPSASAALPPAKPTTPAGSTPT